MITNSKSVPRFGSAPPLSTNTAQAASSSSSEPDQTKIKVPRLNISEANDPYSPRPTWQREHSEHSLSKKKISHHTKSKSKRTSKKIQRASNELHPKGKGKHGNTPRNTGECSEIQSQLLKYSPKGESVSEKDLLEDARESLNHINYQLHSSKGSDVSKFNKKVYKNIEGLFKIAAYNEGEVNTYTLTSKTLKYIIRNLMNAKNDELYNRIKEISEISRTDEEAFATCKSHKLHLHISNQLIKHLQSWSKAISLLRLIVGQVLDKEKRKSPSTDTLVDTIIETHELLQKEDKPSNYQKALQTIIDCPSKNVLNLLLLTFHPEINTAKKTLESLLYWFRCGESKDNIRKEIVEILQLPILERTISSNYCLWDGTPSITESLENIDLDQVKRSYIKEGNIHYISIAVHGEQCTDIDSLPQSSASNSTDVFFEALTSLMKKHGLKDEKAIWDLICIGSNSLWFICDEKYRNECRQHFHKKFRSIQNPRSTKVSFTIFSPYSYTCECEKEYIIYPTVSKTNAFMVDKEHPIASLKLRWSVRKHKDGWECKLSCPEIEKTAYAMVNDWQEILRSLRNMLYKSSNDLENPLLKELLQL